MLSAARLAATPGALAALEKAGQSATEFLNRHVRGDWGDLPLEDKTENYVAAWNGLRLFSSYLTLTGNRLWIITEADRSTTTLLLPDEY